MVNDFFLLKGKRKARLLWLFFDWLSWIVNSSAEHFHLWTALQKMSNISLEGLYWYKDNLSGRRFFGENFQVPWNKDLAFESSLFLVTMTSTTATSEAKNKLARSHILKIKIYRWIDKDRNRQVIQEGRKSLAYCKASKFLGWTLWKSRINTALILDKKHLFIQ